MRCKGRTGVMRTWACSFVLRNAPPALRFFEAADSMEHNSRARWMLFPIEDQHYTKQYHATRPGVRDEASAPKFPIRNKLEQPNAQANDHEPEVFALDHHHGGSHVVMMAGRGSIGGSRIFPGPHRGVTHVGVIHARVIHARVIHSHAG